MSAVLPKILLDQPPMLRMAPAAPMTSRLRATNPSMPLSTGLDLSEFVGVLFDQVRKTPQQAFAGFRRHAAPGRVLERPARGGHCRIDIGGAGLGDARDLLPR